MQISTKEVRDGKHTGKTVWICHYLQPDLDKKPLRTVPPTKALIRSNNELPKNKTVHYSRDHFSALNKYGRPLTKVISPVDNTGSRGWYGNELHVFTEESECIESWNRQINNVRNRMREKEQSAAEAWRKKRLDLTLKLICCSGEESQG